VYVLVTSDPWNTRSWVCAMRGSITTVVHCSRARLDQAGIGVPSQTRALGT